MQITVNGDSRGFDPEISVASLLGQLGLQDQACAVEVNQNVVPQAKHASTVLSEGDRVELVTLVGGG